MPPDIIYRVRNANGREQLTIMYLVCIVDILRHPSHTLPTPTAIGTTALRLRRGVNKLFIGSLRFRYLFYIYDHNMKCNNSNIYLFVSAVNFAPYLTGLSSMMLI